MSEDRDPITGLTGADYGKLAEDLYDHRDELAGEEVEALVDPAVRSVVSVRFNRGELAVIETAASEAGLPISTFIRNAALTTAGCVDVDAARKDLVSVFKRLERLSKHLALRPGGQPC